MQRVEIIFYCAHGTNKNQIYTYVHPKFKADSESPVSSTWKMCREEEFRDGDSAVINQDVAVKKDPGGGK